MPELSDTVELGLTELLANVVRHVPDRRCALLILRQPAGVRVEVSDGSDQLPCTPASLNPGSENGRGLLLLDAMVDKWGVSPRSEGGKTVWFECTRAGSRPVGQAASSHCPGETSSSSIRDTRVFRLPSPPLRLQGCGPSHWRCGPSHRHR
ncbi:ATP-binding protein [Streptomyces sp. NPDC006372]|uniref:ATP-binding protein n=1 Tax=Streptomyces sp. NPDC006372 TaxID=3155599 RepID=UPI0033BE17ED